MLYIFSKFNSITVYMCIIIFPVIMSLCDYLSVCVFSLGKKLTKQEDQKLNIHRIKVPCKSNREVLSIETLKSTVVIKEPKVILLVLCKKTHF